MAQRKATSEINSVLWVFQVLVCQSSFPGNHKEVKYFHYGHKEAQKVLHSNNQLFMD